MVIVDTHDRGQRLKGQRIDLSPYITQVSVDTHLTGGGQASISLPAVQHIEDIVAAGDLVNVYFNLHRNDVDRYNKGNVRVFFGYIDTVNKSVTVDGSGGKLTSYTLTCSAFDKAIKQTQIYNNPHLVATQAGTKKDVVRKDFQNNLGGMSLFSKGIATRGTPRDLVLRNLMRLLGFGGQFILPAHYQEVLPDATHSVTLEKNTTDLDSKLIFSASAMSAITIGEQATILAAVKGFKGKIKPTGLELDTTQLFLEGNISRDSWIAAINQTKFQEFQTAFLAAISTVSPKAKARMSISLPKFKSGDVKWAETFVSNTYFKISTGLKGLSYMGVSSSLPVETGVKGVLMTQLQESIAEIRGVKDDFNDPDLFPSVNMWADAGGEVAPAKTIFNILSLDYLEDVDGYYGNFNYIYFSGSLWGACYQNANTDINELFFDLRPAANFEDTSASGTDGLGIPLDGAIPMVPAVVLREKPFTNYRQPKNLISSPDNISTIKIGALAKEFVSSKLPFNSQGAKIPAGDQLYMAILSPTGATQGFRGLRATAENLNKVKGALSKVGSGSFQPLKQSTTLSELNLITGGFFDIAVEGYTLVGAPIQGLLSGLPGVAPALVGPLLNIKTTPSTKSKVETVKKQAADQAVFIEKLENSPGLNLDKSQVVMSGGSEKQINILGLSPTKDKTGKEVPLEIGERAFSTIFALPKPVFRSPDGGRVTVENKQGGVQRILGVIQPTNNPKAGEPYKASFKAFSTDDASASGVRNVAGESIYESTGSGTNMSTAAHLVLGADSNLTSMSNNILGGKKTRAHILDFVKVKSQDVMNESFSRGDHGLVNIAELFPKLAGSDAQKLYFVDQLPIVTPISIHRFGVRASKITTDFVNPAFLGISNDFWNQKSMIMKWNVMLDMWNQHNHEYLTGSISVRGLPGIRPGYRLDRPELNLSFYVEQVGHTWTYPGHLATQVSVSRGQPMSAETALDYIPPTPNVKANDSPRQHLGQVFETGKDEDGKAYPYAGTFTGEVIKPKSRSKSVRVLMNDFLKKVF
jgi:hypothetical protein